MTVSDWLFVVAALFIIAEFVIVFTTKRRQLSYALGVMGLSALGGSALARGITIENVITAGVFYSLALGVVSVASWDARKEAKAHGEQS